MSDSLPLARKLRPKTFDEVIGQPVICQTLKNALEAGKIHSAYLFTGPRGTGKTTMARILAKALNCSKSPGPSPCLRCDACREIDSSSSLDVLEMDAASNTGVDNVREAIIDTVGLAPHRDRNKIFIMDEAHMLSSAAFNALLKTLEEPPPRVVFVLATTESAKIPPTIMSRCQRFRFKPVSGDVLADYLASVAKKEGLLVEREALSVLARTAEGGVRDAVTLLDHCRLARPSEKLDGKAVEAVLGLAPEDLLEGLAKSLFSQDREALGRWIGRIQEEGLEPAQVARDLRSFLHPLYHELCGVSTPLSEKTKGLKNLVSVEALSFLLGRISRILEELRFSDSPSLTLEIGLIGCLETPADLSAWVERLERLEKRLARDHSFGARENDAPADDPPENQAVPPARPGTPRNQKDSDAWPKALEKIRSETPALAAVLDKAEIAAGENSWEFFFDRSFDRAQAQRNAALIEAAVSEAAGRSIRVKFAEKKAERSAPRALSPKPEALSGEQPNASPLLKAQRLLGGRIHSQ